MKYLLILAVLLFPMVASAGLQNEYWSCMQVGFKSGIAVMVLSDILDTPWKSYRVRENNFAKAVWEKYKIPEVYEPNCQDFTSRKIALEIRNKILSKAVRHKVRILDENLKFKARK